MSLVGRRVLLTRTPERARSMGEAICTAGGTVVLLPLIDFERVDVSLDALREGAFDWLVVTSTTTVLALKAAASLVEAPDGASSGAPNGGPVSSSETARSQRLPVALTDLIPERTRVATVGPATRRALEAEGIRVDLVPDGEQSAAGLVDMLGTTAGVQDARVWMPQSNLAAPTLADGFAAAGAQVETSIAYRTVDYPAAHRLYESSSVEPSQTPATGMHLPTLSVEQARGELAAGALDAVVVSSPSAARKVSERLAPLGKTALIAIGRPTAQAAAQAGLSVAAIAPAPTPEGIVDALEQAVPAVKE